MGEVRDAHERLEVVGKLERHGGNLLLLYGRVVAAAPLGPGAVVHGDVRSPGGKEAERQHRCGDTRTTRRHHGLVEVEARVHESPAEGVRRQERAVLLIELAVWKIEASGHVTGTEPRARLGLGAGEATAGARVRHLA